MRISPTRKQYRKMWRTKNRDLMTASEFDYTWHDKDLILCNGYLFDLHSGTWHKKGNGKKRYGESAYAFIKFLKKENLRILKSLVTQEPLVTSDKAKGGRG